jgi:multiple sugar transport system ATP-binding protein
MSSVSFKNVTKTFGELVAVDDLSIDIADGEFLVVLGPSGCGKSTALRLLAGLETPDSGTIEIGDQVVNEVDPRRRNVAMVFQSYALYPHMTVAKNIESPLIGHRDGGLDRRERAERVRRAAEMLGLAELLDRKPGQLSGGQRQRVALARAIVREPAVFCMDEPLSNLDAKLRAQTRAELVDLHRRLASTFVYVTHDQAEAMSMATRIAVLDEGRLQQLGDPHTVYSTPAKVFVARFIGNPAMNIVGGTVTVEPDGGLSVAVADGRLPLARSWSPVLDGQPVLVGVRPEHLVIGSEGIAATVESSEWLGHEQVLTVRTPDATLWVRVRDDSTVLRPGEAVTLTGSAERVHLFDPDSGERLARGTK